ncbi:VC0807 family protein [Nocardia concava]|uniref:VC0807 family protein n=1 Tax=Nocardia concava TaxID=257281 RepID=UPI00030CA130|nr:VC0807 family protein [Nocardia concava]
MADHTTVVNAPQGAETRPNLVRMLAPTARDIGVPLAAYYALHWAGYSDFAALLAGAVFSGVMVLIEVVRARRIDFMSALILGGFVFGIVSSMISGDARMMIVRDSFTTAVIGAAFAGSALIGKPLTYLAARKAFAGSPQKLAEMQYKYDTIPAIRRTHNRIAGMWGVGLLGEAAVRIVLAYQLPIHTMAWLSSVLMIGITAVLMVITIRTIKRAKETEAARESGYASVHE